MKFYKYILFFVFLVVSSLTTVAQKDTIRVKEQKQLQLQPTYNPLSPSKAAFYSAILPGAGQIYNKRYWWQLPAIYGGLGLSFYYYRINDVAFKRYRKAYKLRKAGLIDEFSNAQGEPLVSDSSLENAQRQTQKNRDLSLLMGILTYVLQIVEASVTAHLLQFDTSDNLTLQPTTISNPSFDELPKVGLTLKYNF